MEDKTSRNERLVPLHLKNVLYSFQRINIFINGNRIARNWSELLRQYRIFGTKQLIYVVNCVCG